MGRSRERWDLPHDVYLYQDPSSATLRLEDVSAYLKEILGLSCRVRDEFFVHHGEDLETLSYPGGDAGSGSRPSLRAP